MPAVAFVVVQPIALIARAPSTKPMMSLNIVVFPKKLQASHNAVTLMLHYSHCAVWRQLECLMKAKMRFWLVIAAIIIDAIFIAWMLSMTP